MPYDDSDPEPPGEVPEQGDEETVDAGGDDPVKPDTGDDGVDNGDGGE